MRNYILSPKDSIKTLFALNKIRFLTVGSVGFVVNYLILTVFYGIFHLPILFAQIIGAETALLATFVGNNFWAFNNHRHISVRKKLIRFHLSAGLGLIVNSGLVVILVHFAHLYYGVALVIGSCVALICNYTLYKHFVFKTKSLNE